MSAYACIHPSFLLEPVAQSETLCVCPVALLPLQACMYLRLFHLHDRFPLENAKVRKYNALFVSVVDRYFPHERDSSQTEQHDQNWA